MGNISLLDSFNELSGSPLSARISCGPGRRYATRNDIPALIVHNGLLTSEGAATFRYDGTDGTNVAADWTELAGGSGTVTFGTAAGEVATWAEGNNEDVIPHIKTDYPTQFAFIQGGASPPEHTFDRSVILTSISNGTQRSNFSIDNSNSYTLAGRNTTNSNFLIPIGEYVRFVRVLATEDTATGTFTITSIRQDDFFEATVDTLPDRNDAGTSTTFSFTPIHITDTLVGPSGDANNLSSYHFLAINRGNDIDVLGRAQVAGPQSIPGVGGFSNIDPSWLANATGSAGNKQIRITEASDGALSTSLIDETSGGGERAIQGTALDGITTVTAEAGDILVFDADFSLRRATGGGNSFIITNTNSRFFLLSSSPITVPREGLAYVSATEQYWNSSGSAQTNVTTSTDFSNTATWRRIGDGGGSGGGDDVSINNVDITNPNFVNDTTSTTSSRGVTFAVTNTNEVRGTVDVSGLGGGGGGSDVVILTATGQDVEDNGVAYVSDREQYWNVSGSTVTGVTLTHDFTQPPNTWARTGDGGGNPHDAPVEDVLVHHQDLVRDESRSFGLEYRSNEVSTFTFRINGIDIFDNVGTVEAAHRVQRGTVSGSVVNQILDVSTDLTYEFTATGNTSGITVNVPVIRVGSFNNFAGTVTILDNSSRSIVPNGIAYRSNTEQYWNISEDIQVASLTVGNFSDTNIWRRIGVGTGAAGIDLGVDTSNDNQITITNTGGTDAVIPAARGGEIGLVTSVSQNFGGNKTFQDNVTVLSDFQVNGNVQLGNSNTDTIQLWGTVDNPSSSGTAVVGTLGTPMLSVDNTGFLQIRTLPDNEAVVVLSTTPNFVADGSVAYVSATEQYWNVSGLTQNGVTTNTDFTSTSTWRRVGDGGGDLGVTTGSNNVIVTNTGGTDATIPAATDSIAGVITTGAQTIGGNKTFDDNLTVNGNTSLGNTDNDVIQFWNGIGPTSTTASLITRFIAHGASGLTNVTLPVASNTVDGLVTTGAQTFAGDKSFVGGVSVSGNTSLNGDINLGNGIADTIQLWGTTDNPASAGVATTGTSGTEMLSVDSDGTVQIVTLPTSSGGGSVDLGVSRSSATVTITNTGGTDAVLTEASAGGAGIVTAVGEQTFGGNKTFEDNVTVEGNVNLLNSSSDILTLYGSGNVPNVGSHNPNRAALTINPTNGQVGLTSFTGVVVLTSSGQTVHADGVAYVSETEQYWNTIGSAQTNVTTSTDFTAMAGGMPRWRRIGDGGGAVGIFRGGLGSPTASGGNQVYTVTHNLNTNRPIVQVYDTGTNQQLAPSVIEATGVNTVDITFTTTVTADAVITG